MGEQTRTKTKRAKAAKQSSGKQAGLRPAGAKQGGAKQVRLFQNLSRKGKVRKEFWLDPAVLTEAKKYLGAASEREAVEMALDLVAFRKELLEGSATLARIPLSRID